jgi:membrane protein
MAKNLFSRLVKIFSGVQTGAENEFNRLERFAQFWALVGKSFIRNRCFIRASALSFSTLLALIPLLAVAISVTSSLLKTQGEERIEQFVQEFVNSVMPPATIETNAPDENLNFPNAANSTGEAAATFAETNSIAHDERVVTAQKRAAAGIHDFIQNTRSGTLGVIGMLTLVFVAIRMLANVEATFNDIWGITRGRGWLRSTVLYWTTITLGPLLLIGALGLATGTHFQSAKNFIQEMPLVGGLIFHLLPLVVLWLTFALIYQLVPNAKVNFSAAIVGALVGGSLWQLNNVFGFLYVSRVVTNYKIYGGLGLVPVFMAGLYFSWLILLFGAQVAYAFQNRNAYSQDKLVENVNQRGREFIALRLMAFIGQRFQSGLAPATVAEISGELKIPSKLVQNILRTLIAARLVVEVTGHETAFAPARPLDAINAHHILTAMRSAGQELPRRDETRAEVFGEFAKIEEAERNAASSITLLALVNHPKKQIENAAPAPEPEVKIAQPSLKKRRENKNRLD